jgi:hypothetical protein
VLEWHDLWPRTAALWPTHLYHWLGQAGRGWLTWRTGDGLRCDRSKVPCVVGRWALGVGVGVGGGQRVWGLVETRGHVCRTRDGYQRADGDRRRKQQQPAPSFVKPVGKRICLLQIKLGVLALTAPEAELHAFCRLRSWTATEQDPSVRHEHGACCRLHCAVMCCSQLLTEMGRRDRRLDALLHCTSACLGSSFPLSFKCSRSGLAPWAT